MGIAVGIFLIGVGAVLRFAVSKHVTGIDLQVVGVILMIVGIAGAVASAVFWSTFSPYDRRRRTDVTRERDVV